MRTMRTTVAAILAAIAIASCQPAYGLFASIEKERPLDQDATTRLMYSTPSFFGTLGTKHFLVAGNLYSRDAGDHDADSWKAVSTSSLGLGDAPICAAAAVDTAGGDLYALFFSGDGASAKLRVWNGTAWSDSAVSSPRTIAGLWCANGHLAIARVVMTTVSGSPVTTYSIQVDSTADVLTGLAALPANFLYFDSAYWLVAGNRLFSGASADSLSEVTGETGQPSVSIAAATVATITTSTSDSFLLLAGKAGTLFARDDSGTWQSRQILNGSGSPYALSGVAVVEEGGEVTIVIGTRTTYSSSGTVTVPSAGYVEYSPGASPANAVSGATAKTTPVVADANNKRTSLEAKSLNFLFYDAANKLLFAGMSANGPWSTVYADTAWTGWVRE